MRFFCVRSEERAEFFELRSKSRGGTVRFERKLAIFEGAVVLSLSPKEFSGWKRFRNVRFFTRELKNAANSSSCGRNRAPKPFGLAKNRVFSGLRLCCRCFQRCFSDEPTAKSVVFRVQVEERGAFFESRSKSRVETVRFG